MQYLNPNSGNLWDIEVSCRHSKAWMRRLAEDLDNSKSSREGIRSVTKLTRTSIQHLRDCNYVKYVQDYITGTTTKETFTADTVRETVWYTKDHYCVFEVSKGAPSYLADNIDIRKRHSYNTGSLALWLTNALMLGHEVKEYASVRLVEAKLPTQLNLTSGIHHE